MACGRESQPDAEPERLAMPGAPTGAATIQNNSPCGDGLRGATNRSLRSAGRWP